MRDLEQHAVITGGGGTLAREIASSLRMPRWSIQTPTRDELDVTDDASIRKYFGTTQCNFSSAQQEALTTPSCSVSMKKHGTKHGQSISTEPCHPPKQYYPA
jgi:hypothetical protein